eukprot:90117-Prymnesium_polylepis.1
MYPLTHATTKLRGQRASTRIDSTRDTFEREDAAQRARGNNGQRAREVGKLFVSGRHRVDTIVEQLDDDTLHPLLRRQKQWVFVGPRLASVRIRTMLQQQDCDILHTQFQAMEE